MSESNEELINRIKRIDEKMAAMGISQNHNDDNNPFTHYTREKVRLLYATTDKVTVTSDDPTLLVFVDNESQLHESAPDTVVVDFSDSVCLAVDTSKIVLQPSHLSPGMRALLAYLRGKSILLTCHGVWQNHLFAVKKIAVHPDSLTRKLKQFPTTTHLELLVQGAMHAPAYQPDETPQRPHFHTKEELTLLFQVNSHTLPPLVRRWAQRNFDLLKTGSSDEKNHALSALRNVLNLDWCASVPVPPSAQTLKATLDSKFSGLEDVKERILEIAAQIRRTGTLPKSGILLNGPAGVGKTTIARTIAQVFGLPWANIELSGANSREALMGSSRIYSNGKSGLIADSLFATGSPCLTLILNEIDKTGTEKGGASVTDALLPLLDGCGFTDNFLEVNLPTSQLFFIATSNHAEALDAPLKDRFLVIDIPPYSRAEKETIWDNYTLPQLTQKLHLPGNAIQLEPDAREMFFGDYATAPGVRDLEKYTEKLAGQVLMHQELGTGECAPFSCTDLRHLLGACSVGTRHMVTAPGFVRGVHWTDNQFTTLTIQAVAKKGSGTFKVLNFYGDFQKAFCEMAYEAAGLCTDDGNLNQWDIVLSASTPVLDSHLDDLGSAVCMAILSAVDNITLSSSLLIMGGCDLLGNLHLRYKEIDSLLATLPDTVNHILAPMDTTDRVYKSHPHVHVNILETPNIRASYQIAKSWSACPSTIT